ncbi:hypothetical protein CDAR_497231 [Caerostris darwini]|uniref:Uncharacterized protein n=1 Tax=Caerostris darwini TaxID=1538125 RepID=A0AAV4S4Z7_9ARAC|nr:hypothetical protein CDAR_497231 [Caerostris darwini]
MVKTEITFFADPIALKYFLRIELFVKNPQKYFNLELPLTSKRAFAFQAFHQDFSFLGILHCNAPLVTEGRGLHTKPNRNTLRNRAGNTLTKAEESFCSSKHRTG